MSATKYIILIHVWFVLNTYSGHGAFKSNFITQPYSVQFVFDLFRIKWKKPAAWQRNCGKTFEIPIISTDYIYIMSIMWALL